MDKIEIISSETVSETFKDARRKLLAARRVSEAKKMDSEVGSTDWSDSEDVQTALKTIEKYVIIE